ncbi:hypothetical protein JHV675_48380 [Mycobacterium avium subsp. hominissuis]
MQPGAYWVPRRLGGTAPTPAEAARMEADEAAARAAAAAAKKAANRAGRPGR